MNGGSARGQAYGVKLDVMIKLLAVKASTSKMGSLMDFVAKTIEKTDPIAAKYYEPWVSLWAAAEIPFKQLEIDIKQLSTEINRVKIELETIVPKQIEENPDYGKPLEKRLKDFLTTALPRMQDIDIKLSQTDDAVKNAMIKYGETKSSEGDPYKDFFTQITSFTKAFKAAIEESAKQKLEEEKKGKKLGTNTSPIPNKTESNNTISTDTNIPEKPKENIFGNFQAAKGGNQADMMAEMRKRMQQKK